jgi:hypothetical protein
MLPKALSVPVAPCSRASTVPGVTSAIEALGTVGSPLLADGREVAGYALVGIVAIPLVFYLVLATTHIAKAVGKIVKIRLVWLFMAVGFVVVGLFAYVAGLSLSISTLLGGIAAGLVFLWALFDEM